MSFELTPVCKPFELLTFDVLWLTLSLPVGIVQKARLPSAERLIKQEEKIIDIIYCLTSSNVCSIFILLFWIHMLVWNVIKDSLSASAK